MALSREQRLLSPVLLGEHVTIRTPPVLLKHQKSTRNAAIVIIPKRFVARAVDRNRAKRQCLALLQERFRNEMVGSLVVRVYTKPSTHAAIVKSLAACLEQLRNEYA